jgi:hypothetical protein
MPIIADQEPNYRAGDFVTTYPYAVVVCTDLPSSAFPDEADEDWVTANVSVAIGTFLGLKTRAEVEGVMGDLLEHGLRILVLDECKVHDILSAKVEKSALELVQTTFSVAGDKKSADQARIVALLMADIFKKTGMIRHCWFFEKGTPAAKRERTDGGSSQHAQVTTTRSGGRRKWWQFWK